MEFNTLNFPNFNIQMSSLEQCFQNVDHFDSGLSSMVSSPSSQQQQQQQQSSFPPNSGIAMHELIGRLGNICGGDASSPPASSHYGSCYSTPLNSPPPGKHALPLPQLALPFAPDPMFAERAAARLSGVGSRSFSSVHEVEKLSRVSPSQSLVATETAPPLAGDVDIGTAEALPPRATSESNGKKTKASSKGRAKQSAPRVTDDDLSAKRSKLTNTNGDGKDDQEKPKGEQNGSFDSNGKESNNAKPPEPPKDYIHVRARRGQATDSHSLAERVRREKISERMKLLQDLVPACNKVTGKAVMLDEIINYVQSLQRQVEFLSMKLATVNPRLEFNMDNFLSKDIQQSCAQVPAPPSYSLEAASSAFSYAPPTQGAPMQSVVTNSKDTQQLNQVDSVMRRSLGMQAPPVDGFDGASSQIGTFWEDDLHRVVQMGFVQSQEAVLSSVHGQMQSSHMEIGL